MEKLMKLFCKPIITIILVSNLFGVYWVPEIPTPGGDIAIYYNTIKCTLSESFLKCISISSCAFKV